MSHHMSILIFLLECRIHFENFEIQKQRNTLNIIFCIIVQIIVFIKKLNNKTTGCRIFCDR